MGLQGVTALVTGAGGFVGSHLVEQLLQRGANVRAFVHYNSQNLRGHLDTLPPAVQHEIEVVAGDVRDAYTVRQAVRGTDIVFHLAASIAIPYSYQSPADAVQTNVIGTLNVSQSALDLGVSRLVHTSTSEVYGTARYTPIDEGHPLQGQSPYSASKIGADKVIESFYCAYGLPVVTVRPFNAFGPRQSMRAVIPTIIQQALTQPEIVLGNLAAIRDFTFVEDTARAFILAAESNKALGQVINAGSGQEISIGDLALKICNMTGRQIPIRVANERLRPEKSEVNRLVANNQLALELLGWRPSVSLTAGIVRTIEWMDQHRSMYRPEDYVV